MKLPLRFSTFPLAAATLFVLGVSASRAEISTPAIFGDHMVLQQGKPIPVWGKADPGEKITVTLGDATAETQADANGRWRVDLPKQPASDKATTMTVKGTNEVTFSDVLLGDVWIASGQSNMEFPLARTHNAAAALPAATNAQLRLFEVARAISFTPKNDLKGKWKVCSPATAKEFSAIGYFFGDMLQKSLKRPVGMIDSTWGGTPAQAWSPRAALESNDAIRNFVAKLDYTVTHLAELQQTYDEKRLPAWNAEVAAWESKPGPKGKKPRKPSAPSGDSHTPTGLYNAMIAPLVPYGITGVIWYQGETNGGSEASAKQYAPLFAAMITGWRTVWGGEEFPFLFVQLAGFGTNAAWPALRQSQTETLALPKTGMALALDIGEKNDIHPRNKQTVAERLLAAARKVAYGEDVESSGPMFEAVEFEDGRAEVMFTHTFGGLQIGAAPGATRADMLKGFEIAGEDGNFVPANAEIQGNAVVVWSETVKAPAAVRYGWASFPTVNLYNGADLPAVPFSSR